MAAPEQNPEMTAAIVKFALIEAVFIGLGLVFYFVFESVWAIVAAALAGSALLMLIVLPVAMRNRPK
jgi:hypothetical protein